LGSGFAISEPAKYKMTQTQPLVTVFVVGIEQKGELLRWPPSAMNLPLQKGNACTEVASPARNQGS